jgi:L-alanine-DL-glutamate epimerase-like enolase superfamily enzyme
MLESSISVAAAVHVAIARSAIVTRIDLDGPSLCAFDPVEGGVRFDGPRITVSDAPGLGVRNIRGLKPL